MQPQEVFKEFSEVSSFEHVPIDLLLGAYAALGVPEVQNVFKSDRHKSLLRASIAAEISIHRDATLTRKRRYSERAHSLLSAQTVGGQFIVGDTQVEPLRAHLPLYKVIPSPDKLPESLARSLFRITDNHEGDSTLQVGFACEVASSMICNGMIQNSKQPCSLDAAESQPLCAETCVSGPTRFPDVGHMLTYTRRW